VVQHFKNLQLTIFVPLVLKHLLDSHSFTSFGDSSFEDNTKRSISDDLLSIVGERLLLAVFVRNNGSNRFLSS